MQVFTGSKVNTSLCNNSGFSGMGESGLIFMYRITEKRYENKN